MTYDADASIQDDAVRFAMHSPEQGTMHVAVSSQALQDYFGASEDASTWLTAYRASFRIIHAVAQLNWRPGLTEFALDTNDFSRETIRELRRQHSV